MKLICLLACTLTLGLVAATSAQTVSNPINTPAGTLAAKPSVVPPEINLPEAETLIYINAKRILNEAVPRFVPPVEVAKLRKEFDNLEQSMGVDPAQIDYVIVAARFRKPSAELNFVPPEFMLVAGGDFGAEALAGFAQILLGDSAREESYGGRNLAVFRIDPIAQEAEKLDFLKSFAEMAIVALSPNKIGIGTPGYLKAAIDAEQGQGRISQEALNSLMRDPQALVSIVGLPLNSFAKSFGLMGVEGEAGVASCTSDFGNFYAAVSMDQSHFTLRAAMNADNANTAKIINGLLSGLLQQALNAITDKSIVSNVAMNAEGHEVLLQADLSQQALIKFITAQMKPTEPKAAATKPAAKTPVKRRAPRRRRG